MRRPVPLKLREFQQSFKAMLQAPSPPAGLPEVRSTAEFPSKQRMRIYHYAYHARLHEALAEDFDDLFEILGTQEFGKMADAYLLAFPPSSWTLAETGRNLALFLESHEPWTLRPELAATARKNWLELLAFMAPDPREVLPVETLAGKAGSSVLITLHPSVQFLEIRQEGLIKSREIIWRNHSGICCEEISAGEYALLRELAIGKTLKRLVESLVELHLAEAEITRFFRERFQSGMITLVPGEKPAAIQSGDQ